MPHLDSNQCQNNYLLLAAKSITIHLNKSFRIYFLNVNKEHCDYLCKANSHNQQFYINRLVFRQPSTVPDLFSWSEMMQTCKHAKHHEGSDNCGYFLHSPSSVLPHKERHSTEGGNRLMFCTPFMFFMFFMFLISSVSVVFCAINIIKAQIITKNMKCFHVLCYMQDKTSSH